MHVGCNPHTLYSVQLLLWNLLVSHKYPSSSENIDPYSGGHKSNGNTDLNLK